MSTEYGIFNAEGCIDRNFWSNDEVESALIDMRQEYVAEKFDPFEIYSSSICSEHDEQPNDHCEECWAEEESEEDDG